MLNKNFGISEFNKKVYYSLVSFILIFLSIGTVVLQPLYPFIFEIQSIPLFLLLILYLFQTRILDPGNFYLYMSFILLRDRYENNYWSSKLMDDIRGAFKAWDEWITKIHGFRVENLKILESIIFQEIHLHPIEFKERIKMTLNSDFFSLLSDKNWTIKQNLSIISNKILSLLNRTIDIDFIPDSIWIKIKREIENIVSIFVLMSCIINIISFTLTVIY